MLIVMNASATEAQIDAVKERVRRLGFTPHAIPGAQRVAIGVTGNRGPIEAEQFSAMPGVSGALGVSRPFKLVSREMKAEDTVIDVGGVALGGSAIAIIAGPCSVESERQILEAAHGSARPARPSSAGALTSLAPARTSSRGCARKGCGCWRRRGPRPA